MLRLYAGTLPPYARTFSWRSLSLTPIEGFSKRKPVVVATTPAAPRPQPEKSEVASPSASLSSQPKLPSRSLRSERWQLTSSMHSTAAGVARVRLTEENDKHAVGRAEARALPLSDFGRRSVLRGTGVRFSAERRELAADEAGDPPTSRRCSGYPQLELPSRPRAWNYRRGWASAVSDRHCHGVGGGWPYDYPRLYRREPTRNLCRRFRLRHRARTPGPSCIRQAAPSRASPMGYCGWSRALRLKLGWQAVAPRRRQVPGTTPG
jgi:hypothetical protein